MKPQPHPLHFPAGVGEVRDQGLFHVGEGRCAVPTIDERAVLKRARVKTEAEQTGSPMLTDGEQTKPSFAMYALAGLTNLAPDGVVIPFTYGHVRRSPRLAGATFRYRMHAARYVEAARAYIRRPVEQAVISASAMSLLYPSQEIPGYPREAFLTDLIEEAVADIRGALGAGAASMQIDFTEARLSLKFDPSGGLLRSFIALNNQVLEAFTKEERRRIGVPVCPGGDRDSTHSADVDYAKLLPERNHGITAGAMCCGLRSL